MFQSLNQVFRDINSKMFSFKVADLQVNILFNDSQNSSERNFELLVDYVDAVKEIFDDLDQQKSDLTL